MSTVRIGHQATRSAPSTALGLSGPLMVLLLLALLIVAAAIGSNDHVHGSVHAFAHPVAR
jgi:hypothetical protein